MKARRNTPLQDGFKRVPPRLRWAIVATVLLLLVFAQIPAFDKEGFVLDQNGQPIEDAWLSYEARLTIHLPISWPGIPPLYVRDVRAQTRTRKDGSYAIGKLVSWRHPPTLILLFANWEEFRYTSLWKSGYVRRMNDMVAATTSDSRLRPYLVWDEPQQRWIDRLFLFLDEAPANGDVLQGKSDWVPLIPHQSLHLCSPTELGNANISPQCPKGGLIKLLLGQADNWPNDHFSMQPLIILSLGKGLLLGNTDMNHSPLSGYHRGYVINLASWENRLTYVMDRASGNFRPRTEEYKIGEVPMYGISEDGNYFRGRIEIDQHRMHIRWNVELNQRRSRLFGEGQPEWSIWPQIPPVAGKIHWTRTVFPILADDEIRRLWSIDQDIRKHAYSEEPRFRNATWNGAYFDRYSHQDMALLYDNYPFLPEDTLTQLLNANFYEGLLQNRGTPMELIDKLATTPSRPLTPFERGRLQERNNRGETYAYFRTFFTQVKKEALY